MKQLIFLFFSFIVFQCVYSQNCKESFLGTKTPYPHARSSFTPAPKGYNIVFINYAGRHGARHLTKEVNSFYAYQVLNKADSLNELKPEGKKIKKMMMNLEAIEKKNVRSISFAGKQEQREIAARLVGNSNIFSKKDLSIEVYVTKEQRTVQS